MNKDRFLEFLMKAAAIWDSYDLKNNNSQEIVDKLKQLITEYE